ncbi:MAG: 50S ribosomal protein L22 [Deltaproteobacteria bacterium]|nr:50S ribosomal protein L22 [Deltaproteobacteria bacterium]
MEVKAVDKHGRGSAQKARLVVDQVRGKRVSDALATLEYSPRAAGRRVLKLIHSAVANAGAREGIDVDTLYVKKIFVDEGPTLKRFRARAMGRGTRILKRTCHITVVLDEA